MGDTTEARQQLRPKQKMNWKHVRPYCPSCEFRHDFKRSCWWEVKDFYVGLYENNDSRARKDCEQELLFGESIYEVAADVIPKGTANLGGVKDE